MDQPITTASSVQTLEPTSFLDQSKRTDNQTNEISNSINSKDLKNLTLSTSDHPVEQADWSKVNATLRNKGFSAITLTHKNKMLSNRGYTILDEDSGELLRKILMHLLQENDRRKEIFSELLHTSQNTKCDVERFKQKNDEKVDDGTRASDPLGSIDDIACEFCRESLSPGYNELLRKKLEKYKRKYSDAKSKVLTLQIDRASSMNKEHIETEWKIIEEHKRLLHGYAKEMTKRVQPDHDCDQTIFQLAHELRHHFNTTDSNQVKQAMRTQHQLPVLYEAIHSLQKTIFDRHATYNEEKSQATSDSHRIYPRDISSLHRLPTHATSKLTIPHLVEMIENVRVRYNADVSIVEEDWGVVEYRSLVVQVMRLFDVRCVDGLYTRMHDVYARYNEMANVLHSVRQILGLRSERNMNPLVDGIGQLAKAKHLLHIKDVDRVIRKVERYDQFYRRFKDVEEQLCSLLGLELLDEIVPAVKLLLKSFL